MRIYGFTEFGGPEVERFLDVPDLVVTPGAVLVRLRAAGLNPADIKVRSGQRQGKVEVRFPMAMGREAAGTVVEDPSGRFREGELVFGSCASGFGALGDLVLLELDQTARLPDGVEAEQAACIPVAIGTAWDALGELGVGTGGTVLVLGAGGGVGVHAAQLAAHLGARVIGVASAAKAELVASAGAEHVESGDGWAEVVAELAAEGVDAVVDAVGGARCGRPPPWPSTRRRSGARPRRRSRPSWAGRASPVVGTRRCMPSWPISWPGRTSDLSSTRPTRWPRRRQRSRRSRRVTPPARPS